MLGSDDQDYAPIIERIEGAAFLTSAQRRGIYYDNAARFLRLTRQLLQAITDADGACFNQRLQRRDPGDRAWATIPPVLLSDYLQIAR